MKKAKEHFLLGAFFLLAFLAVQFTDIYGDSGWFKFFSLICAASFLLSGLSIWRKQKA